MMIVVSNTSPIINLAHIGQLDLLRQLYSEVLIPETVWNEVVVRGAGQPGADELQSATWIQTRAQDVERECAACDDCSPLLQGEGRGEVESVVVQEYGGNARR